MKMIKRAKNAYERSRNIRKTINELSALSDKELNDMGISRGEIYSIAHSVIEVHRETRDEEPCPTFFESVKDKAYDIWTEYQTVRTIHAMRQLSDAQLRDIGIEPQNIEMYVRGIMDVHRKHRDQ